MSKLKEISMDKLYEILMDVFRLERDAITGNLDLRQVKSWDSLKHMQFIFAIEAAFEIELDQDEIIKMVIVSDMEEILFSHQ